MNGNSRNQLTIRNDQHVVNTILCMRTFRRKWPTVHMAFNGGSAGSLHRMLHCFMALKEGLLSSNIL